MKYLKIIIIGHVARGRNLHILSTFSKPNFLLFSEISKKIPCLFRTWAKEAAIGLTVLVLQEGLICKHWLGF